MKLKSVRQKDGGIKCTLEFEFFNELEKVCYLLSQMHYVMRNQKRVQLAKHKASDLEDKITWARVQVADLTGTNNPLTLK
jgi:hypothetical protein